MFGLFKSKSRFRAQDFSVEIKRKVRELIEVIYVENGKMLFFRGELAGSKWEQLILRIPDELSISDQSNVVANLGAAFEKLGREFVIYQMGPLEPIPEAERQSAISQLRELGFEPEVSADGSKVSL